MTPSEQGSTDVEQVTARDRIHIKLCRDARCVIERNDPGKNCKTLDYLLDVTEEQVLHQAAARLLDAHMGTMFQHGPDVASGLVMAAKEVDPYERREGGVLVRKADGTPVPRYGKD